MRTTIQFITSLFLLAAAALALAAPPRLTGLGQAEQEATQVQQPAPETPAAAPAPEAVAPAATDTAAPAPEAVPPKSAEPKKSAWAAFWDMFRRNGNGKQEQKTGKQTDQLVNTQEYHKETHELLGQGDLHRFEAGYHTGWRVQASNVMCSLNQAIPDYGHVEFRQGVGQPLVFALYVAHPPAGTGRAHVRSEAPHWQHYVADRDLGVLELETGKQAVTASSVWSRRLLLELSDGMQPVMRYWDAADATDDMEITLSAINFRSSLALFHRCIDQLQQYDVEQVERIVINFNEDSSRLRAEAVAQLADVLEIYRTDRRFRFIELEVYTHRTAMERYDFRLATRRTRTVRDYFIKQGVDEDKLLIKIHTKSEDELKALGYRPSDVLIALRHEKSTD